MNHFIGLICVNIRFLNQNQYFTIVFWNYDQEKKKAVISDYYEISSWNSWHTIYEICFGKNVLKWTSFVV